MVDATRRRTVPTATYEIVSKERGGTLRVLDFILLHIMNTSYITHTLSLAKMRSYDLEKR
jgi:hypothetical protein